MNILSYLRNRYQEHYVRYGKYPETMHITPDERKELLFELGGITPIDDRGDPVKLFANGVLILVD